MEEPLRQRWLVVLMLAVACGGGRAAPPSPDTTPATRPPDLTGRAVMVLPAQAGPGAAMAQEPVPGLDREIAYWLAERGPRVRWVFPPLIQRAVERSPSLGIDLHAMPVASFHVARVENIGDPLFGQLHALANLVDARWALVPVAAEYKPDGAGSGRVEIMVALIDTMGGRVLWLGAVAGQPGAQGSTGVAASAAGALAQRVTG